MALTVIKPSGIDKFGDYTVNGTTSWLPIIKYDYCMSENTIIVKNDK